MKSWRRPDELDRRLAAAVEPDGAGVLFELRPPADLVVPFASPARALGGAYTLLELELEIRETAEACPTCGHSAALEVVNFCMGKLGARGTIAGQWLRSQSRISAWLHAQKRRVA